MIRVLLALLLLTATAQAAADEPMTVAVAFDRHRTRTIVAEGVADPSTGRLADSHSPVRIASISKLITALGVMRLVDAGTLDLDRDVSDYLGWRLRHPTFPEVPITLRMLLAHRAGLADGPDLYIVPLGESLRDRLADPRVWDPANRPGGDRFAYANINFPVVASVMESATGERFDRLMTRLVFAPLRIDACLNWSGCSADALRRAVVLRDPAGTVLRDDLKGAPPRCLVVVAEGAACDLTGYRPGTNGALFSPQGGVRIAMRDLAKIGQMLARKGKGLLSPRAYAAFVAPAWRLSGNNGRDEGGAAGGMFCAYALAVQTIGTGAGGCRDDLFGDRRARIGHSGDAYGLRSGLWVDLRKGRGIAFFTTAVPDDAPTGASAFTAREEAIARRALRRKTPTPPIRD